MKCPSCLRPVDHEAVSCYSCGYSFAETMEKFGGNRVEMSRIHDAAHCFRKGELDDLNQVLDSLELRFPQMLFCLYLGELPENISMSELGFWLLNRAQVKGAEYARPNDNAVLVLMDMQSRQVGLSLGYLAEMLVTEEEAYRSLIAARPHLVNGEYAPAMSQIFNRLGKVLARKARLLKKMPIEKLVRERLQTSGGRLDLPRHHQPPSLRTGGQENPAAGHMEPMSPIRKASPQREKREGIRFAEPESRIALKSA